MNAARLAKAAVAVVIGVAVVVGVLLFAQSRDSSTLDQSGDSGAVPGRTVPVQAPAKPAAITRDGGVLTDDQVRTATGAGDVVLLTGDTTVLADLKGLQQQLGPFDAKLAKLGQVVVIGQRAGVNGVRALAKGRELEVAKASDPRLTRFVDAHLGGG